MLGLENLYFKLEMLNPSGSYKDRFAASAVSELRQHGLRFCLATSSGNTGAALAAYCAAAGIKCYLTIVDGAPVGKVQQMRIYGAQTLMVKDFGLSPSVSSEVFSGLQATARQYGSQVQISAFRYSPVGMAGVQTIAYEVAEQLPAASHIFSPAGGGGLTLAVANGFSIWGQDHPGYQKPKVHCVQPTGNDTISAPLRNGLVKAEAVSRSMTTISGLQVPNVIDGDEVIAACRASGGTGFSVADDLIYDCHKNMAVNEGIFCEPAGAVALAGVMKAVENREIRADDHIVCLVTGHGFKDPASGEKITGKGSDYYFKSSQETLNYIESQITEVNHL
jgi:threonine synthase